MKIASNQKIEKDQEGVVNFLSFLNASDFSFPTLYSKKYFEWKVRHNPYGESFCYLRYVAKDPVAMASITAKPLNEDLGLGVFLAELGDTHTHPHFQRQGHFGEIGTQVINDFNMKSNNTALIFGIPNDNAVHGWQSRCGCKLLENLRIFEYSSRRSLASGIKFWSNLEELSSAEEVKTLVDSVWERSYKSQISLVKKDSDWWMWRYNQATESYRTFALLGDGVRKRVYLIAKISRKFVFSKVEICDVVGETERLELEMLEAFITRFRSPFAKFRIWTKAGSQQNLLLEKCGFRFTRKINFVLFQNEGYRNLCEKDLDFTLDLGDTDNV